MHLVRDAEAAGGLAEARADIAASFQRAAVDALIGRTLAAAEAAGRERVVVAGGVGANALLRAELASRFVGEVYFPPLELCTDNGAMIAAAGALRLADAREASEIQATARWSLETLQPPAA